MTKAAEVLRDMGRAEGEATIVLRVLRRRCGEPAEAVVRRVLAERDAVTMERWLDIALACTNVEEFQRAVLGS